jgi:hypothetical protein
VENLTGGRLARILFLISVVKNFTLELLIASVYKTPKSKGRERVGTTT